MQMFVKNASLMHYNVFWVLCKQFCHHFAICFKTVLPWPYRKKLRKFVHGVDFTWDPRGGAYRLNTSLDSIVHLWEQVSAYVLDVAMLISYLNAIITREIKIISAFVNICLK